MSEPKPVYTITQDTDMGVTCPTCGVVITIGNAGGYRAYCEGCVESGEFSRGGAKGTELLKAPFP